MLVDAAEAGAARVAARLMPHEDMISQNEAFRRYGRRTVETWVKRGLVKPRKVGTAVNSRIVYSQGELHSLCRALETSEIIVSRKVGSKS